MACNEEHDLKIMQKEYKTDKKNKRQIARGHKAKGGKG
jgi:hypothetical protein